MVEFLQFAERNLPKNNGVFYCPCVCCENSKEHENEKKN